MSEPEDIALAFIKEHFPKVIVAGSDDERTFVRFFSYVIRFASKKVHNVQAQALMGGLYGMLNLFGVRGTMMIFVQIMKQRKAAAPAKAQEPKS